MIYHICFMSWQYEVATSVSILPSGFGPLEFDMGYIKFAVLDVQYEVATSASILPWGV